MKLVTIEVDGKTYAKVEDGKPVFNNDGKEVAIDVADLSNRVSTLNHEAMTHRQEKQTLSDKLKAFEGIEDPKKALKALQTVQNLDQKQLVDAGEVERIKSEAISAVEDKYKPVVEERDTLQKSLRAEMIGGRFSRSPFVREKMVTPPEMVEATFGSHFSVEDGKVVAKDQNGNPIYSKQRPGELASFDEAVEHLVNSSPFRDQILKGRGHQGGGAPGAGNGAGGSKTISRSEFNTMDQGERVAKLKDGFKVVDDNAA